MKLQTIHYLKKNAGIKSVSEMSEEIGLLTKTISGYASQLKISLRTKKIIIGQAASR